MPIDYSNIVELIRIEPGTTFDRDCPSFFLDLMYQAKAGPLSSPYQRLILSTNPDNARHMVKELSERGFLTQSMNQSVIDRIKELELQLLAHPAYWACSRVGISSCTPKFVAEPAKVN